MIDSKYGLKYSFPHSVVHINDNSANDIVAAPVIVNDPSLYATIVASAMPMGKDGKIVNLTRSDVLNVAFGANNITKSDIQKYGQTVTYPSSLIGQGAPVRLLRVTPEDSTYAFSAICIEWKEIDERLHVRFTVGANPETLVLSEFKNTERLYKALEKEYKKTTDDGWTQRLFMANISAGRGRVYNNMITTIDSVSQSKKPANIAYMFTTVDTRNNATLEQFTAALINYENPRVDYIEPVNTVVSRRMDGSSVIVPYVNEAAILELYNKYIDIYTRQLENSTVITEDDKNIFKTLSVNTFDVVYGNYIYNGSGLNVKLPFYSVDMKFNDIPSLDVNNRYISTATSTDPKVLWSATDSYRRGVNASDTYAIGSVYVSQVGSSSSYPKMSIITGVNQYTGAVTSVNIPKLYGLKMTTGSSAALAIDTATDARITYVTTEVPAESSGVYTFSNDVMSKIKTGDVICQAVNGTENTYKLYYVSASGIYCYDDLSGSYIYDYINWSARSDIGNVFGYSSDASVFYTPGYAYYASGVVGLNYYDASATSTSHGTKADTIFTLSSDNNNPKKFGPVPTSAQVESDLIGTSFDIENYDATATVNAKTNVNLAIVDPGEGLEDGATLAIVDSDSTIAGLTLTVSASNGYATKITVTSAATSAFAISKISGAAVQTCAASTIEDDTATYPTVRFKDTDITTVTPASIDRWCVTGTSASLYRFAKETVDVPANYYDGSQGINPSAETGGVKVDFGSTGFFDQYDDGLISSYEFKYRYSALLVKAYRGLIDPAIMSPTRCPAKYLFDGGTNTIVGHTVIPGVDYPVDLVIGASTIFDDDEKDDVLFHGFGSLTYQDIDVKQAMYDLMEYRVYQGIPENMRPIGPGSGLSLHLDSGNADNETIALMNVSFNNRFNNPNASWDIGGYVSSADGIAYTFTKRIVDRMIGFCKANTSGVNKPFTGLASALKKDEYISYFPDIDSVDWDLHEKWYNFGGNNWIADINGNLVRQSQRSLLRTSNTSDLVQESNMRTLSQLVFLLQNKINNYLLEYNDDGVLKTLSDEVNNMFASWIGSLVDTLEITFERDTNVDGGDIIVCYVNVTFRGLILRVPVIVNVNRRA